VVEVFNTKEQSTIGYTIFIKKCDHVVL